MARALALAREGLRQGETPVGAVIVRNGTVIGSGYNRVEKEQDPTAHAEIIALREACRATGNWRLPDALLYVTLEPCIMCAAALIHARIERVVYAVRDTRWGGFGTLFDLSHDPRLNHEIEVIAGVMEEEAAELLQGFFRGLRNRGVTVGLHGNGQAIPETP
jgi:tRNA(adenine34) deaminase